VLAWYDNEAGYSARVIDLCRLLGSGQEAVGRSTCTRVPVPGFEVI
jgi:hypothetical protein